MKNRILAMIENYRKEFDPSQDMNMAEAMNIIDSSQSKAEIAENSYLYGHMRATYDNGHTKLVPLYNMRQMSDDEWAALSARNKREREALA